MNNSLFYPKTRSNASVLHEIILKHNLTLDYECKNKKVFSNEELLVKIERRFFFIYVFDSKSILMEDIRKQLNIS